MFNYEYLVSQCKMERLLLLSYLPPKCLAAPSTSQCPGRSLGLCLSHMVSDLRQKRKLHHLPRHLLVLLPPKTIQHSTAFHFSVLLLDNQTIIFSDMSSAPFTGRSDRTLQCALPALLEDTAAFKQSFDLQAALTLIHNSHSFYRVNRRHSSD